MRRAEQPEFEPVQPTRAEVWLSSVDVKEAITRVGLSRGSTIWRACCWDIGVEINKLIQAERERALPHGEGQ